MLTTEQKKYLRTLALNLPNKYQVGKNEITDTLICMLDKALIAKELIKIDLMKGVSSPVNEIAIDLSSKLNAEIVQIVGKTVILFRRNKLRPIIQFKK